MMPLPTRPEVPGDVAVRGVGEHDQPGLLRAAGVDAEDAAAAHLDELGLVEGLHLEAVLGTQLRGDLRDVGGRQVTGRGVGEVTGHHRRADGDLRDSDTGRHRCRVRAGDPQLQEVEGHLLGLGLQHRVAVARQQCALGQHLAGDACVDARGRARRCRSGRPSSPWRGRRTQRRPAACRRPGRRPRRCRPAPPDDRRARPRGCCRGSRRTRLRQGLPRRVRPRRSGRCRERPAGRRRRGRTRNRPRPPLRTRCPGRERE